MAICEDCKQEMLSAASCTFDHVSIEGVLHRRVWYGSEPSDWGARRGKRCGDCGVKPGGFHHPGCDIEHCPASRGQLISCGCDLNTVWCIGSQVLGQVTGPEGGMGETMSKQLYWIYPKSYIGGKPMPTGGRLIKEARLRAGLTQQELADRMGTSQPVIARWESGRHSPTVDTLLRAVRACGLDVSMSIVMRDAEHERHLRRSLRRSPEERLDRMVLDSRGVEDLLNGITIK